MITLAAALEKAISAVCPIAGVSIGRADDKATWHANYMVGATDDERAAAAAVIAAFDPAALPYPVTKTVILQRLHAARLLRAADLALNSAATDDAVLMAERWYAAREIMSDDPDARAFLTAIGANPDEVLAP